MKFLSLWIVGYFFLLLAIIPAHAQSYESELKLGVEAYKGNLYEQAILHFRKATELDPSKPVAHLYLATSFVSQHIPGVESPDNIGVAEEALEQYQRVLDSDAESGHRTKDECHQGHRLSLSEHEKVGRREGVLRESIGA